MCKRQIFKILRVSATFPLAETCKVVSITFPQTDMDGNSVIFPFCMYLYVVYTEILSERCSGEMVMCRVSATFPLA